MASAARFLLATAAVAAVVGMASPRAFACGTHGYSYAGLAATQRAFGISAIVTPLDPVDPISGHVAGWVGVGGPGEGPNGTDEWLQVGLSGFPGLTGSDVYYEVALPHRYPTYYKVEAGVSDGTPVEVSVVETRSRPDWWRVYLNGRAVSRAIRLPGSRGRWTPIATAESWSGSGGSCNSFLYRFHGIRLARAPGGRWRRFSSGEPIRSPVTRIRRSRSGDSFLAAEGPSALRLLAALTP